MWKVRNELYHHGIQGQKWGIRRYQNPDGTLTEEGKKRYGSEENFKKEQTKKRTRIAAGAATAAVIAAGAAAAYAFIKQQNKLDDRDHEIRALDGEITELFNENEMLYKDLFSQEDEFYEHDNNYDVDIEGLADKIYRNDDDERFTDDFYKKKGWRFIQQNDESGGLKMNRHMYFRQQEKNVLAHHGILGQKWGIRRFQNPDGSYTAAGKERYGRGEEKKQVSESKQEEAQKDPEQIKKDKARKAAMTVGMVAVTAAATLGAAYLINKVRAEQEKEELMRSIDSLLDDNLPDDIDEKFEPEKSEYEWARKETFHPETRSEIRKRMDEVREELREDPDNEFNLDYLDELFEHLKEAPED